MPAQVLRIAASSQYQELAPMPTGWDIIKSQVALGHSPNTHCTSRLPMLVLVELLLVALTGPSPTVPAACQ